ncbi:MAG TPA: SIS domain-containing protein [Armatimonadota bacterium]|nr:SIS domain-containing protein [Armatimonadota bacterium]
MMDRAHLIKSYLGEVSQIISELPADVIDDLVQTLKSAYNEGRCVMICGNGGSAATASHLACDLQKGVGCLKDQKFKAIAFTDAMPIITAWANDTDYDNIFAEQVVTWAQPGDILIAISGSGNSPNILRAVEAAKVRGVTTIGLTGMGGGKLAQMVDKPVVVASNNMQQVEDVHVVLAHLVFTCLCREIKGCG